MLPKFSQLLILSLILIILGCKTNQTNTSQPLQSGLYKVAIFYPNGEGKTFDMTYYQQKHMPMVAGFLGSNLKLYEIEQGISGRVATDKAPYLAIGYFYVADIDEYNKAIGQHRDEIINDFKNYCNVQPLIQISELKQVVYNHPK